MHILQFDESFLPSSVNFASSCCENWNMSEVVADSEVAQKVTEWLDWDKAGIPPHVTYTRHLNVVAFKLSIHTALEMKPKIYRYVTIVFAVSFFMLTYGIPPIRNHPHEPEYNKSLNLWPPLVEHTMMWFQWCWCHPVVNFYSTVSQMMWRSFHIIKSCL